jgi:large subunit ribosomal protein L4
MDLKVLNNKGQENGTVQFDENLLPKKGSKAVLHEIVVAHLAGQRSGTHAVKTRAEVSGGGLKPWRQKGTGRARSGSTRSPLWRKGGIIFGPVPRDYSVSIPKKKKQLAFGLAVKSLLEENRLQVVDAVEISEPKTKHVAAVYAKWQAPTDSVLLVDKVDANFHRAARNIAHVKVADVASFNVYDALRARRVFITRPALEQLSSRFNKNSSEQ